VEDHIAGEGEDVAYPVLMTGVPLDGDAGCGRRFRLSNGQNLLARIFGKGRIRLAGAGAIRVCAP
jgi:hypothetical protein